MKIMPFFFLKFVEIINVDFSRLSNQLLNN